MNKAKKIHGTHVVCDEEKGWTSVPYTEEEIRQKLEEAKQKGASYARVHTVNRSQISLYKRDASSPSGSMKVGGVPKTKANWKLVREIIRSTRSPGSLRRGTDY